MVAWSALLKYGGVKTVPYNCYEIGHTWSSDCPTAIYMFAAAVFKESVKLYVVFYVVSFLIKRKKISKKNVYKLLSSISQSTFFLTSTGFFYLFYTCAVRYVFGEFNTLTASFVPALLCNITCIPLERPDRLTALAGYVTNAALETGYRMLAFRKLLPIIPNGQIILFSCAIALYMHHIRKNDSIKGDILSSLLKKLLTNSDVGIYQKLTDHIHEDDNCKGTFSSPIFQLMSVWTWFKSLPKHPVCLHTDSCISSCTYGFLRGFTLAYACQCALSLARQLMRNPKQSLRSVLDRRNLKLGLFVGFFSGTYKMMSCLLKWIENKDSPWHEIPAGLLAGLSMYFYKSSTIAIYVAWRMAEVFYERGVKQGYLRYTKLGAALLYSVSAGILFHAGVVEPHNLSPSYYKFLSRTTRGLYPATVIYLMHGGRGEFTTSETLVDQVNRHLMQVLGVESSTNFPDFLPNLDKLHMTPEGIAQMTKLFPLF